MKTIAVIAASAFLGVTVLSSFSPAYAAAPGAMSGKGDYATRGYRQAAKQKSGHGAGGGGGAGVTQSKPKQKMLNPQPEPPGRR